MKLERRRGLGSGKKPVGEPAGGPEGRERSRQRGGGGPLKRLRGPWFRLCVVVVVSFAVGYLISTGWLFPRGDSSADLQVVRVPDLGGRPLEDARTDLEARDLSLLVQGRIGHPEMDSGRIVAQDPLPGQLAARRGTVYVTVSRGADWRTIPDLQGVASEQAEAMLTEMGFAVRTRNIASNGLHGGVQGSDPAAGERVALPAEVELLVSQGPQIAVVPDLSGRHVDDVEVLLEAAGLQLGSIQFDPEAPQAPGRVVAQNPPPGYSLRGGGFVSIEVAGRAGEVEIPTRRSETAADSLPPTDDGDGRTPRDPRY